MTDSMNNGARKTVDDAFGNPRDTGSARARQWHETLNRQAEMLRQCDRVREEHLRLIADRISALNEATRKLVR